MQDNLLIESLDYDKIRDNFVNHLKSTQEFKDFDFQASGISTIINMLSYNTHFLGYYINMLNGESNIASIKTFSSMYAKAENLGYTIKGKKSARTDLVIKVDTDLVEEPDNHLIVIKKGTSIQSVNNAKDTRIFYLIDDVYIYNRVVNTDNTVTYTSNQFPVFEGSYNTWKFKVHYEYDYQRFIIKDENIDIDTLKVYVRESEGSSIIEAYNKLDDVFDVDNNSPIYYVTMNPAGQFELYFGNDIYGKRPKNGSIIECSYMTTSGLDGNGAKIYTFNSPAPNPNDKVDIGNFKNVSIISSEISYGGADQTGLEELRFNIPNHYLRQNRLVTAPDYYSILLDKYKNIESISVWGGEDNYYKTYGKVFVSIKSRYSDYLPNGIKSEIRNFIMKEKGIIGSDIIFVEPEFIDVKLKVKAKVDFKKTSKLTGEIESLINKTIIDYNNDKLGKFDQLLSEAQLMNACIDNEQSIVTLFSDKELIKSYKLNYNTTTEHHLLFGNKLEGEVYSSNLTYGQNEVYFKSIDNNIFLFNAKTGNKLLNEIFGSVDFDTGVVKFKIPKYAKMIGFENETSGIIQWHAFPLEPDINTYNNNIVRIIDVVTTIERV